MAAQGASSSWISYGTASALGATSDWTAHAIIKPTSDTGSDTTIVSKRNGFSSGANQFQLALGDNNNRRPAITKDNNYILWATAFSLDTEYILTITATSSIARCWVNGTEITSVQVSSQPASSDWQTGAAASSANLEVFSYNSGTDPFLGILSEVALWDVGISDAEVASLYAGCSPRLIRPTSLKMHWRFIGGALNESRQGYSPTVTGTIAAAEHPRIYS